MEIAKTIAAMRAMRRGMRGAIGFVPTMGYLHEGHLALVRRARCENQSVVVSIFVNPTQFGPNEDFNTYPRDMSRDLQLLEREGIDVTFIPTAPEIYPPGFDTWVEVGEIAERLEGTARPGHLRGVATIVIKLFNIVEPQRAYFGQKDAQQAIVIKKVVADLNIDLETVVVPTVREEDGLALSSRNTYLNRAERQAATILLKALTLAKRLWEEGRRDTGHIRGEMAAFIRTEPLAKIDYISIADVETLEELTLIDRPVLVSLVVRIGGTRLIDNIILP